MMEALRLRARGRAALTFAEFMDVALYDPIEGYYRRGGPRIGYGPGTDFLTATASAPLFGRLVVAACTRLLGSASPSDHEFVEIGAEPGAGILRGLPHPFRSVRTLRIGDALSLEGPTVVFSNELFDAQPFRRFRYREGAWRELGVAVGSAGLSETETDPDGALPTELPSAAPEGYVIDASLAAAALARSIAGLPWTGLFLAFDYGKSWEELAHATPGGTARAYRRHAQGNDLLGLPGEQDITCHVCWDWLRGALVGSGFGEANVESQEAFFTRHAGGYIEAFASSEAGRLSREKLSLLQLLHPANMGQRFQALWALRPPAAPVE
jgi:SAM-dependent MidA family methyltransferase